MYQFEKKKKRSISVPKEINGRSERSVDRIYLSTVCFTLVQPCVCVSMNAQACTSTFTKVCVSVLTVDDPIC